MVLILVWLLVILFFSVIPTGEMQTQAESDKIVHFIMYGITSVLLFKFIRIELSITKTLIVSVSLASFYGFAMELLQSVLPWRTFSLLDEVANIGGAFFFGIMYAIRESYRKK